VSYDSASLTGTSTFAGPISGTEPTNGNFNTFYVLGNLWYDFDTGGGITPYVGGGLGAAVLQPNFTDGQFTYDTGSTVLAAQLGIGVKLQLADSLTVDLGYRAKAAFNGTISDSTIPAATLSGVNTLDQTVQVGLTLGF